MDVSFWVTNLCAASIIATLIFQYQSGEEAIAVLAAESCITNDNVTSLNIQSEGFEELMNLVLPITIGVFALCKMAMKEDNGETLNGTLNLIQMLIVHLPIVIIIIQTIMIVLSECPSSVTGKEETIRLFGYAFIALGAFFAVSSVFTWVNMPGDDSEKHSISWFTIADAVLRCAAFTIGYIYLNDDANTTEYLSNHTQTKCYEYFNSSVSNQTTIENLSVSQNSSTFKHVALAFAIISGVEVLAEFLYFMHVKQGWFKLDKFPEGIPAFAIDFIFTASSRLTLTIMIAGMVLDRSELECHPMEQRTELLNFVVLATISFIPNLFGHQLAWHAAETRFFDMTGWNNLYAKVFATTSTGSHMDGTEYSSFMG